MYNDIETNPGPPSNLQQTKIDKSNSRCCGECEKTVRSNQNGVYCDCCRRLFRLKCTGLSSSATKMNRGIPQGSVLGPLFFNIFVNDLHFDVTNGEINTFAAVAEISVGWGGQLPPPPPPLVELSICRKFSFYRKFGNTRVIPIKRLLYQNFRQIN